MATYIIEGTITELSANNKGKFSSFKICGAEGYALQRKNEDKIEKYNVISEQSNVAFARIFKNDSKLECDTKFFAALTTAFSSSKRIRLEVNQDKSRGDFKIAGENFGSISSLTLLSD